MSPQNKSSSHSESEIPALTAQCSTESSMSLNNDLLFQNNNTNTNDNLIQHQHENGTGNRSNAFIPRNDNNEKGNSVNSTSAICNSILAVDDDHGNFSPVAKEDSDNRLSVIANSIITNDDDNDEDDHKLSPLTKDNQHEEIGNKLNTIHVNNDNVKEGDNDDNDNFHDSITLNDSQNGLQLNGYLNRIGNRRKQVLERFYTAAVENPCNTWKCNNPLVRKER